MKKQFISFVVISLIAIVGVYIFRDTGLQEQEEMVIGGDRDSHGCLIAAGYTFNEKIGACARAFELTLESEEAARIAVEYIGEGYALTISDVKAHEDPGVYDITIERGEERVAEIVFVRSGSVAGVKPVEIEIVDIGTDGKVTAVDISGVALGGPALISLVTDGGGEYTIAVPTESLPLCVAKDKIATVYDIAPGDEVSVRGKTNEEGQIVPCESETHQLEVKRVYSNPEVGLSLKYRIGPDGYIRRESEQLLSDDPSFIVGVVFMNKKESEELLLSDIAREFPPTIQIRAYSNPEKLSPADWAKTKSREINSDLALTEPVEIAVGEAAAVGFTVDGLYTIDTYVIAYSDYVYVVMGEYRDTESEHYKDIDSLVTTMSFTEQ